MVCFGRRMVGANLTTELWRPHLKLFSSKWWINSFSIPMIQVWISLKSLQFLLSKNCTKRIKNKRKRGREWPICFFFIKKGKRIILDIVREIVATKMVNEESKKCWQRWRPLKDKCVWPSRQRRWFVRLHLSCLEQSRTDGSAYILNLGTQIPFFVIFDLWPIL